MGAQLDFCLNNPGRLELAFREFHRRHPEVFETLRGLALHAVSKGKLKLGIGMLWEVMRWELYMRGVDDEPFKLNNNYRSRYARLLMEEEPVLRGVFEIRELKTD